jgi:predicted MFS family arabinose efflux permease
MNNVYRMTISQARVWGIWLILTIFYAYQFVLRIMPGILMPEIMAKFAITSSEIGWFSGMYYIGYAAMHVPMGIMLDRLSVKNIVTLCLFFCVSSLVTLVYNDIWLLAVIGRFLLGIGSAASVLGLFKIIRTYFPENKFTKVFGIAASIGLITATYGGPYVNMLSNQLGWQNALVSLIVVGFAQTLFTYILIPNRVVSPDSHEYDRTTIREDLIALLTNRKVLIISVLGGMMVGPLEGFADVWGPQFLIALYGMGDQAATSVSMNIYLGMCLGLPVVGYIADKTRAYYQITTIFAFVMGVLFVLLMQQRVPHNLLVPCFLAIGVCSSYQLMVVYKVGTYVKHSMLGLTTAVANMIIVAFGFMFHMVIGKTVAYYWDGAYAGNVPKYGEEVMRLGVTVVPVALFLAAVGFAWVLFSEAKCAKQRA